MTAGAKAFHVVHLLAWAGACTLLHRFGGWVAVAIVVASGVGWFAHRIATARSFRRLQADHPVGARFDGVELTIGPRVPGPTLPPLDNVVDIYSNGLTRRRRRG